MPRFNYSARSKSGRRVDGIMLAETEQQLTLTLRDMDLYLLEAKLENVSSPFVFGQPVKRRELINFTVHLAAALGAGIPILQAFEDLEQQTDNRAMHKALQTIREALRGGSSLSEAMSQYPRIFSEFESFGNSHGLSRAA